MGWDSCSSWTKKSDVVNDILRNFSRSEWKVHAKKTVREGAWFVVENTSGAKFIYFALISKSRGEFALKTMTEHMGPSYYSCPVSFLDIADAPAASEVHAIEWRRKLVDGRKIAEANAKRTLAPGTEIKLYDNFYTVVAPNKNTFTVRSKDGRLYKLTVKQMSQWEYATKLGEYLEA
jgi:hypothetical protein